MKYIVKIVLFVAMLIAWTMFVVADEKRKPEKFYKILDHARTEQGLESYSMSAICIDGHMFLLAQSSRGISIIQFKINMQTPMGADTFVRSCEEFNLNLLNQKSTSH
jgi:hypothetical protein